MAKPTHRLHDAFPARKEAAGLASDLNKQSPACGAKVRKLKKPQDGGRLKYGVYVSRSCRL